MAESKEQGLEKLLNRLGDVTVEPIRPGLAEEIKGQIPGRLSRHRGGLGTINIIIDLRVNKLAAAAAIIITGILCANFFVGRDSSGAYILQDSGLLARYYLGRDNMSETNLLVGKSKYEQLVRQGKDAAYYGDVVDAGDSNAVLVCWRVSENKYKVFFADLRQEEVSARQLIKLQRQMLESRAK